MWPEQNKTMRSQLIPAGMFFAALMVSALLPGRVSAAAGSTTSSNATATPSAGDAAQVKLPYGAPDVLKLSRAKVGEEVILAYIEGAGTIYSLTAEQIVYLRNEGVSDRVVTAMLEQKNKYIERVSNATAQNSSVATTSASAPAYDASPTVYAQPAPTYVPASTVYVIPYSTVRYGYYGYYGYGGYSRPYYSYSYCAPYSYGYYRPYYRSYAGYYSPSFSIGFSYHSGHSYGSHYHACR